MFNPAPGGPAGCWLAENHLTRRLFGSMVRRIEALLGPAGLGAAVRGQRVQKFVYKGLAAVSKKDPGAVVTQEMTSLAHRDDDRGAEASLLRPSETTSDR